MKHIKKIIFEILLSLTTLCVITVSFAWIKREWAPEIYHNNLSIKSTGTLAIMFGDESGLYSEINLAEKYSSSEFKLSQVSNYSGRSFDFFKLNYDEGVGYEKVKHIPEPSSSETYSDNAKRNGYIEESFIIFGNTSTSSSNSSEATQTYTKYVYIDEGSYIRCLTEATEDYKASQAIRVSITIHGLTYSSTQQGTTYLFRSTRTPHEAITNAKNGDTYVAEDAYIYNGGVSTNKNQAILLTNPNTYLFSDFAYCYYDEDLGERVIDTTKNHLFQIADGGKQWVTIRIWLEGNDPNCVDEISDKLIDLNIIFRCIDIQDETE